MQARDKAFTNYEIGQSFARTNREKMPLASGFEQEDKIAYTEDTKAFRSSKTIFLKRTRLGSKFSVRTPH
jgi:hypothetical protein